MVQLPHQIIIVKNYYNVNMIKLNLMKKMTTCGKQNYDKKNNN